MDTSKVSGARTRTRRLSLPPAATSPHKARRFATALLDEWDLEALSGSVEFIVSELVTNAALHARTDIEVLLTPISTGVRVEVRDRDSGGVLVPMAVPAPAPSVLDDMDDPDNPGSPDDLDDLEALLTAEATTGRGLRLVAGLATDWGVDRLPTGKAVWAEVRRDGSPRETVPDVRPGDLAIPAEGRVVRLIAVPVRLALESDLQLDALVREFQVMASGGFTRTGARPLIDAAAEILDRARPLAERRALCGARRGRARPPARGRQPDRRGCRGTRAAAAAGPDRADRRPLPGRRAAGAGTFGGVAGLPRLVRR